MPEFPHQVFANGRVMVMSAPNGARRTRADHPALPITPAHLAEEAESLLAVGVSVLHVHVRDETAGHTLDVDAYRAAIAAIAARVGDELLIQVTTEAVGIYQAQEQMAVVRELRPEAFSMALREINPDTAGLDEYARFCHWAMESGIWPQFILYTPQDLRRFDAYCRAGLLGSEHPSCLFVLGNYAAGRPGSVVELGGFLDCLDCSRYPWSVCCFGPAEVEVMCAAYQRGGHVRIGFENNLVLPDGEIAGSNSELVSAFLSEVQGRARCVATAREARDAFLPSN